MATDTTDSILHSQVKTIVDELEAAVSGSLYKIDGNYVVIDDLDGWKAERYQEKEEKFRKEHHPEDFEEDKDENGSEYDSYDEWMEYEIGTVEDIEEPEEVSLAEYIDDQSLGDVRMGISLPDQSLNGGKVLFCCGGPTVWVADDEVRGYWGSSKVEMSLDSDTRSALFSWFEELWNATKG
jgi:hypothetical protein